MKVILYHAKDSAKEEGKRPTYSFTNKFFKNWIIIFTFSIVFGCAGSGDSKDTLFQLNDQTQNQFIDNIAIFCGKSYVGKETFIAEGRESWADKEMKIHFGICENDKLAIKFWLGADQSRTWLLIEEDGSLRLRHDHRNVDGTPEVVTLYGGYANEKGSETKQLFPADEYTCEMLPNACEAHWEFELTKDPKVFSYSLFNRGVLLFRAEFDLERPIEMQANSN